MLNYKFLPLFALVMTLGATAQAADHKVNMKSISYDPKSVEIKVGDTVEWVNQSYTDHSATSEDPKGFNTGLVDPKKTSRKITFDKPGTYPYHCTIHGVTMSGKIIVNP